MDLISTGVVLSNIYLLCTSRLGAMIKCVAYQGILLSVLPLLMLTAGNERTDLIILAVMGILVKGMIIPACLFKAIRNVDETREINTTVGYSLSIVYGVAVTVFALYIVKDLAKSSVVISPLHASMAIIALFDGLFLIVARRNVVAQIVGYLVFESAGYILGLSVAAFQPIFVEMGILLDMLVGIFIMVVAVNHINAKHNTISIESLERLTH
jgi:hydrogenase-4 component E